MTTIKATIKGRRLEVDVPPDWPEGAQVEIHPPVEPDTNRRFRELVAQWKEATEFMSSSTEMVMHPAYQQIIGMGPPALPLLVEELRRDPDHWFAALKSISREDPVPSEDRGKVQRMVEAWLAWGESRGY